MSFIAAGLGIAGLSEAALTVAAGEAIGAGVGALTNPHDRLKGALMGGLTGAVGGGIGAGIGALGGAASGAVDAGATAVADEAANATTQLASKIPGQTLSEIGSSIGTSPTEAIGGITNVAPTAAPTVAPSGAVGGFGSTLAKTAGSQVLNAAGSLTGGGQPSYDKSGQKTIAGQNIMGQQLQQETFPGWQPQGKAHGGTIHLRDGDFIIPADVVSAIGNGSTKAGAEYLDHLFNALRAGPKPKAGSLAKRRAKERSAA